MSSFNNGYYKVGGKIFLEKVEAIYHASQTKKNIAWYFHDDLYTSLDWTTEPTESLNDLYKQRAQQLRNKYDYLVIFFSGGADSTNMVYSFLNNGIHIDEIVAGAPLSGLKNWEDSNTTTAENTISETRLAQIPGLKKISDQYSSVKITVHDYFQDMLEYKTDEWLWKSGSYIHPTFAARYRLERDEYNHLKRIADSGKKIGFIYGLDKPNIIEHQGNYYTMFRDTLVNNAFQALEHPMAFPELFYYNTDVPKLLIKQAHVTAKYISLPGNKSIYDDMLYNSSNESKGSPWRLRNDPTYNTGRYERAIVPAIYPMLNETVFQADKPRSIFFAQHDDWFGKLHKDTRAWQLMQSDFNNFIRGIDENLYNVDPNTKVASGFYEYKKFYKIGPVSKFKSII